MKYQGTHGKCNCVFSLGSNTYNISSLISTNGSRFHTEDQSGWSYSFNPCVSFKKGSPSKGNCQSDVAICRWVFNQKYIKIGTQSSEECGFYKHTKIPKLQYSMGTWKAAVLLKCNPNEKEGIFKVREDKYQDDYEFTLTHQCVCANSCLFRPVTHTTKEPTATTDPNDPVDVTVPIVASVAGVLGLVIVPIIIWRLLKRPQNNERRHLLDQDDGDRRIDESENHFSAGSEASELTLGRRSASSANPSSTSGSSCSDITETNKNSFNKKINRIAEGHC